MRYIFLLFLLVFSSGIFAEDVELSTYLKVLNERNQYHSLLMMLRPQLQTALKLSLTQQEELNLLKIDNRTLLLLSQEQSIQLMNALELNDKNINDMKKARAESFWLGVGLGAGSSVIGLVILRAFDII